MKKILLLLTIIMASSFTSIAGDKIEEAEVTFNGQSDKAYYFTNTTTGKLMEFTIVSKKAVSKYDLNEKKYIGKTFIVSYEVDSIEVIQKDTQKDVQVKQYKKRLILMDIKEKESIALKD